MLTGLFVRVVVYAVHDPDGARRLLQLYAVQVVYADGGQRLLLVLLLVLHGHGQFGLGPVQRCRVRVCGTAADRTADALQVLRRFDESVVVGARGRKLWRNERCWLLRSGRRRRRRPTAVRGIS